MDHWHGRFMSSVAGLTITKSFLSSLHIFTMGLFLLADIAHDGFDKHFSRFFLEWSWPEACHPKYQGGMCVTNSRFLGIALMPRWNWRLSSKGDILSVWHGLLPAKYPRVSNIISCSSLVGHNFGMVFTKSARVTVSPMLSLPDSWPVEDYPRVIKFLEGTVPQGGMCVLCGQPEDANHIFFSCVLASFMWNGVHQMLGFSGNQHRFPSSFPSHRNFWEKSDALCGFYLQPKVWVSLEHTQ